MPKSGACRERGKRSGLASTTRPQALCALGKRTQRPAVAAAVVVTALRGGGGTTVVCAARSGVTQRAAAPCRGPASGAMPLPCAWLVCCYRAIKRRRPQKAAQKSRA